MLTSRAVKKRRTDNRPIIQEILALRSELAKLLGFETFADYQIDDAMAKTPASARELLERVWRGPSS